jgi:protease-4
MEQIREIISRPRSENVNQVLTWLAAIGAAALLVWAGIGLSSRIFPKPQIGLIYVDTVISGQGMPYFSIPLNYAAQHDEIVGVVLVVNSPGGSASISEELFYRTRNLRDQKPIVVSVMGINASGAYYMSMGANYIIAKPAALVGSIGVVSGIPGEGSLSENQATTGPFKGSGSSEVDWIRGLEVIKNAFATNVFDQRSFLLENMHSESWLDRLPAIQNFATGQVWFAPDALKLGIIDQVGSDLDAIAKAAELAGVSNYEIVDLTGLTLFGDGSFLFNTDIAGRAAQFVDPEINIIADGPYPTFYHLYIPPND